MMCGSGCLSGYNISGRTGSNGQAMLLMAQRREDPLFPAQMMTIVVTQVVLLHGQLGIDEGLLGPTHFEVLDRRLMIPLQLGPQMLLVPQMMMMLLMGLQLLRLLQLLQSLLLMGISMA